MVSSTREVYVREGLLFGEFRSIQEMKEFALVLRRRSDEELTMQ
jgi:hypothetical protein